MTAEPVNAFDPRPPLRVAMFSRYPNDPTRPRGGVESVTLVLARSLAARGDVEVHVVTLEPGLGRPRVEADGLVNVHRLVGSHWPQIADIRCGPGRARLWQYLLELDADVVHAHETHGLMLAGFPAACVFTVHGFDHENLRVDGELDWPRRLRAWLWQRATNRGLARHADIISISPYVRRKIEPLTRARIHDIDNPVDPRFFQIDHEENSPAGRRGQTGEPARPGAGQFGRVLCTGWLNDRKNPLGAVAALANACRRGANGTLVFAGSAKQAGYVDRVRSAAQAAGLADHVEFLGHVDRDQLASELSRATVLLLPSRQENAPMAVAEAMAAGLPVIASNRCGMPFMVDDGQTGFLVDPEDPEQIGDRLTRLLADPDLCNRMGRLGREVARERFHPDRVAERTVAVYHQAMESLENHLAAGLVRR